MNVDYIVRGGDRLGIYFLESGASQRPSKVIYDRAHSAVSKLKSTEVDWQKVFENATWFHWTGITPALGQLPQECLEEACKAARAAGATISCDLNFRKKLWTPKQAQAKMRPLMEYVDVCIANEEDAEKSLGLNVNDSDVDQAKLDEAAYFEIAEKLKRDYGFQTIAITLRESFSASRNGWSALLLDNKDCQTPYHSRQYDIQIVDRVGGGDAFAGALIFALLSKKNTKDALEFAVAASCLKQTIPGDFNLMSAEEIEKLAGGSGSGRVER